MCRVMAYECCGETDRPLGALLSAADFDVLALASRAELVERVLQHRPDVLVYGLGPSCEQDLGVLRLLRRVAPEIPLILVSSDDSLLTQKLAQELRPIYYAVRPVDDAELHEAVRAAATSRRPRTGTAPF